MNGVDLWHALRLVDVILHHRRTEKKTTIGRVEEKERGTSPERGECQTVIPPSLSRHVSLSASSYFGISTIVPRYKHDACSQMNCFYTLSTTVLVASIAWARARHIWAAACGGINSRGGGGRREGGMT